MNEWTYFTENDSEGEDVDFLVILLAGQHLGSHPVRISDDRVAFFTFESARTFRCGGRRISEAADGHHSPRTAGSHYASQPEISYHNRTILRKLIKIHSSERCLKLKMPKNLEMSNTNPLNPLFILKNPQESSRIR